MYLKIEVIHLSKDHPWGECLVKIVEQDAPSGSIGIYNGIYFKSVCVPEIEEDTNTFFLRGDQSSCNNMTVSCSYEFLKRLRKAIAEFNKNRKEETTSKCTFEVIE